MPSFALIFGIVLIVVGSGLAVFERRVLRRLSALRDEASGDSRHGRFFRERSLRRLKIGLWILLLGIAVTNGESIEPRKQPILYLGSWTVAAITAVVLVRAAALDYIALRRHWGGEILRNDNEIERLRRELRQELGPDAE